MTLPVINAPTYDLTVPSTKEKIKYRPFLVKEEKILLLAMEEDDEKTITLALKQIIENCTDGKINVDKLALFDLEFIFLRIRAKSVGETVSVSLLCDDDGETYVPVEIPLEEIKFGKEIGIISADLFSDKVFTTASFSSGEKVQVE